MAPVRYARLARPRRRRTDLPAVTDVPLEAHFAPLRRHAPAVVVFCLLGALVGAGAVARQETTWTATTRMLLPNIPMAPSDAATRRARAITVDTEAQILLSAPVVTAAADQVPGVSAAQLRRRVSVSAPPNTRVVRITVTDTDPARAGALGRALAEVYLEARRQLLAERRSEQQRALRRQVQTLRDLVAASAGLLDAADPVARTPQEVQAALLSPSLEDDAAVAAPDVAQQIKELQATIVAVGSTSVLGGEILSSGTGPQEVPRNVGVPMTSWTMLGLLAGLTWGRLRERYAQRVWSASDLAALPGEPGSAAIAALPDGPRGARSSVAWDALVAAVEDKPGVRVVTPVGAGSYGGVAVALVRALRRRGVDVTLVLDQGEGVLDPLGSPLTLGELPPEGRHAVVAGPPFAQLLRSLWLPQCDEIVLVVVPGRTSRRELAAAVRRAAELGVRVTGVVIDRPAFGVARHGPADPARRRGPGSGEGDHQHVLPEPLAALPPA